MESFLLDPTTTVLAQMQAFLLVFFRITGIFERTPIIGGGTIPRQVKIWLSFFVAALLFPIVVRSNPVPIMPQSIGVFAMAVLAEFTLGLLIGMVGSILLVGIQLGGRKIDDQMGFSLANIVDPVTQLSVSITSQLVLFVATVLFVVMGGLNQVIIPILAGSFDVVPLIGFRLTEPLMLHMLEVVMPQVFVLAIVVAAPTIIVVFLSTIALGLMGKVVPEMNIFSFSFGVRVFGGLTMLWVSMNYLVVPMEAVIEATRHHMSKMLNMVAFTAR